MDMHEISELLVEADFMWREIEVGDYVQVEDPITEQNVELLSPGKEYMVVVKDMSESGSKIFITETNIEGCTAKVYPVSVCDYTCYRHIQHS